MEHERFIARRKTHIDDGCHHDGDKQLEHRFKQLEKRCQKTFLTIFF